MKNNWFVTHYKVWKHYHSQDPSFGSYWSFWKSTIKVRVDRLVWWLFKIDLNNR